MKPSLEELRQAVSEAERLRAAGEDTHALAKTLLYQEDAPVICVHHLKDVCLCAERVVKFSMDEHEHALLVKALDTARRAEKDAVGECETLGLG